MQEVLFRYTWMVPLDQGGRMACVINFQLTSTITHNVLCDERGEPLLFRDCDMGWNWFNANHDAFNFKFPAGQDVRNFCLAKKTRDVYADIEEVVGKHWERCRLKLGIRIPPHILA